MDLQRNWVIEAGAGTGKTYHLVQGMLRALFQKRLPLSSLVALTFTKKAAGEMKERVAGELTRILQASAITDDYREWGVRVEDLKILAARALDEIDRASISTIHSFAFSLLQRYPLAAGINPGAEIDEKGLRLDDIFSAEWSSWLAKEFSRDTPHAEEWISLLKQVPLGLIEDLARRLCDFDIPLGRLPLSDAGIEKNLEKYLTEIRDLIARHPGSLKNNVLANACEEVIATAAAGAWEKITQIGTELDASLGLKPHATKEWSPGDVTQLKRLQKIAWGVMARGDHVLAQLTERLKPFLSRFRAIAMAKGVLSHNALLALACHLVRTRHDVRLALKREFRMIFIDEFQDTDPLQGELLLLLAEDLEGRATAWTDVALEAGKLFVVGDPKQSIYHFRGADISAYRRIIDFVTRQGASVMPLQQSRRSHDQIIHAVNAAFSKIIQEKGLIGPPYVPLEPLRTREPGPVQDMELLLLRSSVKFKAEESRDHEARDIARWIGQQKAAGHVDYRDVALIFRSTLAMHPFVEALRTQDIPFVVEGERYFYTTPEVTDLINFLRIIENPSDRLALVGFLRSPLGGLTDPELVGLQEAGQLDAARRLPLTAPEHQRKTWDLIDRLHVRVGREPLKDVLRHVFEDSFLMELAARSYHRDQTLANVLKLKRLLESFAEDGVTSLRQLLNRVQSFMREGEFEGESPLADESYNAVRLLTIHKAKGLEFPVVILPNLQASRRARPDQEKVSVLQDWGSARLGLRLDRFRNLAYIELEAEAEEREEEEEKRVLYVAMTRARERLIISGSAPAAKDSYLSWLAAAWEMDLSSVLAGAFSIGPSHITVRTIDVADGPVMTLAPDVEDAAESFPLERFIEAWERRAKAERAALRTPLVTTPSGLESGAAFESLPVTSFEEDEAQPPDRARYVGTLVHQFLEHWDFQAAKSEMPAALREAAHRVLGSAGVLNGLLPDPQVSPVPGATPNEAARKILAEAQAILDTFIGSEAYRELSTAAVIAREMSFFYKEESVVIRGQIDILYRLKDGSLVVGDYKTDRIDADTVELASERYRAQTQAYQAAVTRGLGEVVRAKLIYLRLGKMMELSPVITHV